MLKNNKVKSKALCRAHDMLEMPKTPPELREIRVKLGLSVSQLGLLMGMSAPAITNRELGLTAYSPMYALALSYIDEHRGEIMENYPHTKRSRMVKDFKPGTRWGALYVMAYEGTDHHGHLQVAVKCDCGKRKTIRAASLRTVRACHSRCYAKPKPLFKDKTPNVEK